MKLKGLLLLGAFITGCSGWNSELDTQYIPDPVIHSKPKCQFKLRDNCWSRSLQLITSCASQVGKSEGIFTDDLRFCSHHNGDFVEFLHPSQIVQPELKGDIEINVYSKSKRCYHLKRSGNEILIDQNAYGEISATELSNGDVQVSCLFGESFTIPAQAKQDGCRNEKASTFEFVPGMEFNNAGSDPSLVVHLTMMGTGVIPLKLLSCKK